MAISNSIFSVSTLAISLHEISFNTRINPHLAASGTAEAEGKSAKQQMDASRPSMSELILAPSNA